MKKVSLFSLLLLLSVAASAQVQFALGVKAGPNFANIDTKADPGQTYKNRTGFHGGAFALFKLTKIGIQPELLFSQQGSKVEINGTDLESNFNYINVPIILKLYLAAGLNLQVGPQLGFVSKAEVESFVNGASGSTTKTDVKDQLKGQDLSLALGAGWDLPFGLTLDARYNLGLSKVNDSAGSEAAKNQVFQVSLGYKFIKLGK
jgi:hypothetical protein